MGRGFLSLGRGILPRPLECVRRLQLRRAAVSIPSNIAEGQGRSTTKEFLRFLAIARGSLFESETQILIATRLSYLNDQQSFELAEAIAETGRLINGLSNSLKEKLQN